jgi:hypothetical protein
MGLCSFFHGHTYCVSFVFEGALKWRKPSTAYSEPKKKPGKMWGIGNRQKNYPTGRLASI